jgi:hypothetical protein
MPARSPFGPGSPHLTPVFLENLGNFSRLANK